MENIKLKHSKLGNTAKKISALCAAGLLFLTPLSAQKNKLTTNNLNPKKQIENMVKENTKAQNLIDSFRADEAKAVRVMTLSHPYRNLKDKTIPLEQIDNELVALYTQNIAELVKIADVYRAYGIKNLVASGMVETMYNYALNEDEWKNHTDEENLYSRSFFAPMYVNLGLKTETGILTQSDEATFHSMDKIDGINEYLTFEANGSRNVNQELGAVTNWIIQDMYNQIKDTYKITAHQKGSSEAGAEKFGQQKADEFMQYIKNIKKIVSQNNLDTKSQKELEKNINAAIAVTGQSYGTVEMRGALIDALTSMFGIDKIQKNLIGLGYDINNNKTEALTKLQKKISSTKNKDAGNITLGAGVLVGNQRTIINTEFDYTFLLNKLDLNLGVQVNPTFGRDGLGNSVQVMGKTGIATKPNQAGWNFNANLLPGSDIFYTDGANFTKGATFALGGDIGVKYQIPNSNITIGAAVNGTYNFTQQFGDIGGTLSMEFKNRWGKLVISLGYAHTLGNNQGHTIEQTPTQTTTTTPTQTSTDEPPYDTEETTETQPTDTTDLGEITDIHDKPVDLTNI
ncbi:MAG: hypothetical protein J5580_00480 [Clostridia bacterium]|nr:hypothetical protein [Clostridia bacterium]